MAASEWKKRILTYSALVAVDDGATTNGGCLFPFSILSDLGDKFRILLLCSCFFPFYFFPLSFSGREFSGDKMGGR